MSNYFVGSSLTAHGSMRSPLANLYLLRSMALHSKDQVGCETFSPALNVCANAESLRGSH
jgi:hypothetical protein